MVLVMTGPHQNIHNTFHREFSLVVSSSYVDFQGARAYIQKNLKELMPRGNNASTRVLLLSGSHGSKEGSDALCSLQQLNSNNIRMPTQTRKFYTEWCNFFKLKVEGEDPRIYDKSGKVEGILDAKPPRWEERVPNLIGLWKKKIGILSGDTPELILQIVDIAWYHKKVSDLLTLIRNFQPNCLILDWDRSKEGFTVEKIKSSGIVSRMILENELCLLSGNKLVKLSEEQNNVLVDVENMVLKRREGSIVFLYGSVNTGKMLLGIEAGRILASKRRQIEDKEVEMVFCTDVSLPLLLNSTREKYFQAEMDGGWRVESPQEILKRFQLGQMGSKDTNNTFVDTLGKFVSSLPKNMVLVLDDLCCEKEDWQALKAWPGLDLVVLSEKIKHDEKVNEIQVSSSLVRTHQLFCSYRQGHEPFMAYKYMMTHLYSNNFSLSWADQLTTDVSRCPKGQNTTWIENEEGVTMVQTLERVRHIIEKDDSVIVVNNEKFNDNPNLKLETAKKYCSQYGWIWVDAENPLSGGYESEVGLAHIIVIVTKIF